MRKRFRNHWRRFAEISEDNPNVWFELGYALAREKPLCLVCSATRTKFPFDVQHRKIIPYPTQPLPKDYEELRRAVTERLIAVVAKEESRLQNAQTASSLSVAPETNGLAPHELLALILIFEEHFSDGTPALTLAEMMKKSGYTKPATNLAVTGLIRKKARPTEVGSLRQLLGRIPGSLRPSREKIGSWGTSRNSI